jgi:hypothetical protein
LYRVPSWRPLRTALFFAEVLLWAIARFPPLRQRLSYYCYAAELSLRRRILRRPVAAVAADLVVCEVPQDSEALLDVADACTLYDCPTPWADELYDEGRLTARQWPRMRVRERTVLEATDHLCYFWRTYGWYVRDRYPVRTPNLRVLDYGCRPGASRATFGRPLRIVYMGSLSSRFINLPLLARLAQLYPHIDVYGGPAPDPALGLRYLGPAPPSVLTDYQLGIITCTTDELRCEGFSAKHLEYLGAGLPVLVPRWRRHLDLLRGSIGYDEESFLATIEVLSDPATWQAAADAAHRQATELTWERTLEPLDRIATQAAGGRPGQPQPEAATAEPRGSSR